MINLEEQFRICKKHSYQLLDSTINNYFPNGGFDKARDKFFDVPVEDIQIFYKLDYPFRGEVVFNEEKFAELVSIIPEFVVSLIKVGMPVVITLSKYQTCYHENQVMLSLDNLRESSEIVYHASNLLRDSLNDGGQQSSAFTKMLNIKLNLLDRDKSHYDLLGVLQNVYNSVVMIASSFDLIDKGAFDLYIHPNSLKRETLYSLAGRELNSLKTMSYICGNDSIDTIAPLIRESILKNGYPQLNMPMKELGGVEEEIDESDYIFQLQGDIWKLRFKEKVSYLNNSKGLYYIYTLLNNPQKAIRADTLKNLDSGSVGMPENIDNEKGSNNTQKKATTKKYYEGKNKTTLKENLETLEHLRGQETPNSDYHKKLDDEIEELKKYIRRNFNLFDKPRPTDLGEKARQAVLKAIKRDIKRVKRNLPELYQHLDRHITTGYECIYNPPNEEIKSWQFKA